ncbi:MAG TPA: response regulator transcription factor [Chloroflexota bacterium]|jgi:two-component system response regulator NreC|nr:response regulator transcription factor [Chloroflexota bacterium]
MSDKIRIVVADDHAVLRAGLRALLNAEPDMEVVGEAANGREAVERAEQLQPDVIVMDLSMPVMGGLDATKQIKEKGLPTRVLVLTVHAEQQYLLPVLQAGGAGYVLKQAADTELIQAIRTVHRGEAFLYPAAANLLIEDYRRRVTASEDEFDGLSEREREVLKLTAEGFSSQEIADKLIISAKTVDTYRQRIMDKLDIHHRSELIRYALRKGLLTAPSD